MSWGNNYAKDALRKEASWALDNYRRAAEYYGAEHPNTTRCKHIYRGKIAELRAGTFGNDKAFG